MQAVRKVKRTSQKKKKLTLTPNLHCRHLANIFQGRIEYELIYSLRGAMRPRKIFALVDGRWSKGGQDTFIGMCLGVCKDHIQPLKMIK